MVDQRKYERREASEYSSTYATADLEGKSGSASLEAKEETGRGKNRDHGLRNSGLERLARFGIDAFGQTREPVHLLFIDRTAIGLFREIPDNLPGQDPALGRAGRAALVKKRS